MRLQLLRKRVMSLIRKLRRSVGGLFILQVTQSLLNNYSDHSVEEILIYLFS
jgi:hypothetical protein